MESGHGDAKTKVGPLLGRIAVAVDQQVDFRNPNALRPCRLRFEADGAVDVLAVENARKGGPKGFAGNRGGWVGVRHAVLHLRHHHVIGAGHLVRIRAAAANAGNLVLGQEQVAVRALVIEIVEIPRRDVMQPRFQIDGCADGDPMPACAGQASGRRGPVLVVH